MNTGFLPINSFIQQHRKKIDAANALQTSLTQLKRWQELGAVVISNRVFIPAANFKEVDNEIHADS